MKKSRKKSNKSNCPRRWRMNRQRRLQAAPAWISTYVGKDIARGYQRWFHTDRVCALVELKACGVPIPEDQIKIARQDQKRLQEERARSRRAKRKSAQQPLEGFVDQVEQTDYLAYIAGYTSWGIPYGITWEEYGYETEDFYDTEPPEPPYEDTGEDLIEALHDMFPEP
ncbi:MAG: hypothetical protein PHT33_00400 [bacterium]|nr:hypothetical protein [bacterium]